ncbi:MAG TPA: MBOAT family O-acyltransferase, partial [Flavobacterium sp.]
MSLIANIGVLAVFKYYNFLNENLSFLIGSLGYQNKIPFLYILLPIGLSFHTFQAMSYTIEVYRGNYKAEKNFGIYALYVMFFPQLVAGPIERPQNILPQFHIKQYLNYEDLTAGFRLMLWGFFKKIVIADRLAVYVDSVYNNAERHSGITLLIATIFFAFQIYCDFSGYSDIALGTARVMGYRLMLNFRRPYLSRSIKEFWSRWHISLSTWFRDYLYIPLGGNRVSKPRWYLNIFIVFMISGLWHGASWTYIIWGALHGFYQVFGLLADKLKEKIPSLSLKPGPLQIIFQIGLTFILATFAWIFFRANSVQDAFTIVNGIFTWKSGGLFIGSASNMLYSLIGLSILFIAETSQEYLSQRFNLLHNRYK